MTQVQERMPAGRFAVATALEPQQQFGGTALGGRASSGPLRADMIRRIGPPQWFPPANTPVDQGPGAPWDGQQSGLGGIMSELMNIMQQLASMMGMGGFFGNVTGSGCGSTDPQQYFNSARGGSNGDPHLSFNGQTWNNMQSDPDLLDSNSFNGGFQIATTATQPGANGVTYNQQASITTNYGGTQVSLDNAGDATVLENGEAISLQDGQTLNLGEGESVARNQNGSVVVTDQNGMGGSITTTLSDNGQGVDVNFQANDVGLGGDLANHSAAAPPTPEPYPVMQPWLQPQIPM